MSVPHRSEDVATSSTRDGGPTAPAGSTALRGVEQPMLDPGTPLPSHASSLSFRQRSFLVVLAFAIYVLLFPPLYRFSGHSLSIGALVTLPTLTVAVFFGSRPAIVAVFLSFLLNMLLLNMEGNQRWHLFFREGGGPGTLVLLLVSAFVGRLRDQGEQIRAQAVALARERAVLQAQVAERWRTELALRQSEERYRLMVEGSEQVFFYFHDANHQFEYLSPSVRAVIGYEPEELIGQPYNVLLKDDPVNEIVDNFTERALQSGERYSPYIALCRHKDGRLRYLELMETPVEQEGQIVGMQGFARDITERKQAEQLQRTLYEVAEAVHETPDLRMLFKSIHHSLGQLIDVSNFYVALCEGERTDTFSFPYQVDAHDSFTRGPHYLPGSLTAAVAQTGSALLVDRQRYHELLEANEITQYGTSPASWLGVPLILNEVLIGVVVVQSYNDDKMYSSKDIEVMEFISKQIAVAIERKRAEQALRESKESLQYLAHHDVLTRLPNRVLFYDRLRQALAHARRYGRVLGLLYIDLDGFKAVNDGFGHDMGDLLLREVAQRLRSCMRESDTVARIGGDEFTVILPDISGPQDAARVAEKILATLAPPFHIAGQRLELSASIGISLYPADDGEMDGLIKRADSAMYEAKETGKNRYHCYQSV